MKNKLYISGEEIVFPFDIEILQEKIDLLISVSRLMGYTVEIYGEGDIDDCIEQFLQIRKKYLDFYLIKEKNWRVFISFHYDDKRESVYRICIMVYSYADDVVDYYETLYVNEMEKIIKELDKMFEYI